MKTWPLTLLVTLSSLPLTSHKDDPITFTSLTSNGLNVVFSVTFDNHDHATVRVSYHTEIVADQQVVHVYDGLQEVKFDIDSEVGLVLNPRERHWIISFDDPVPVEVIRGSEVTVSSDCADTKLRAHCLVEGIVVDGAATVNAIPGPRCSECVMSIIMGHRVFQGSALILKASGITVEF